MDALSACASLPSLAGRPAACLAAGRLPRASFLAVRTPATAADARLSSSRRDLAPAQRRRRLLTRASLETSEIERAAPSPPSPSSDKDVQSGAAVLKRAGESKKVPGEEVFDALSALQKAKLDPAPFLATLGGAASPGRAWMLVFSTTPGQIKAAQQGGRGTGSYFPVTAVQRFDAAAMEVENGVYLGPFASFSFMGPIGWSGRRLSFLYTQLCIKLGPLGPFKFNVGKKDDEGRVPGEGKEGQKDPFFLFFYADDGVIAARGRGGGDAFWRRCERVAEGQFK